MSCQHERLVAFSYGEDLVKIDCRVCGHTYKISHPDNSLYKCETVLGRMVRQAEKQSQIDYYKELERRAR